MRFRCFLIAVIYRSKPRFFFFLYNKPCWLITRKQHFLASGITMYLLVLLLIYDSDAISVLKAAGRSRVFFYDLDCCARVDGAICGQYRFKIRLHRTCSLILDLHGPNYIDFFCDIFRLKRDFKLLCFSLFSTDSKWYFKFIWQY